MYKFGTCRVVQLPVAVPVAAVKSRDLFAKPCKHHEGQMLSGRLSIA